MYPKPWIPAYVTDDKCVIIPDLIGHGKREDEMKVVKRNVLDVLFDHISLVGWMDRVVDDAFDELFRAHADGELRWRPRGKQWREFETVVTVKSGRLIPVRIRAILCRRELHDDSVWFLLLGDFKDRLSISSYEWRVRELVNRVAGPGNLPEVS